MSELIPIACLLCGLTSIGSGLAFFTLSESPAVGFAAACLAPVVLVVALLLAPFVLAAVALYFAAACLVSPFHAVVTVFSRGNKEKPDA